MPENEPEVKTINLTIPADFEGAIYCSKNSAGESVFEVIHRNEAGGITFPPLGFVYDKEKTKTALIRHI